MVLMIASGRSRTASASSPSGQPSPDLRAHRRFAIPATGMHSEGEQLGRWARLRLAAGVTKEAESHVRWLGGGICLPGRSHPSRECLGSARSAKLTLAALLDPWAARPWSYAAGPNDPLRSKGIRARSSDRGYLRCVRCRPDRFATSYQRLTLVRTRPPPQALCQACPLSS